MRFRYNGFRCWLGFAASRMQGGGLSARATDKFISRAIDAHRPVAADFADCHLCSFRMNSNFVRRAQPKSFLRGRDLFDQLLDFALSV